MPTPRQRVDEQGSLNLASEALGEAAQAIDNEHGHLNWPERASAHARIAQAHATLAIAQALTDIRDLMEAKAGAPAAQAEAAIPRPDFEPEDGSITADDRRAAVAYGRMRYPRPTPRRR